MLSRPEVGSCEHVLLWIGSKDQDDAYTWMSDNCPWAQYAREHLGLEPNIIVGGDAPGTPVLLELNRLANPAPHTFGALHERAQEFWGL